MYSMSTTTYCITPHIVSNAPIDVLLIEFVCIEAPCPLHTIQLIFFIHRHCQMMMMVMLLVAQSTVTITTVRTLYSSYIVYSTVYCHLQKIVLVAV